MEGKVSKADLAISDPTAKNGFSFRNTVWEIERGSPSSLRSKIRQLEFELIYTQKETQGRSKVGGWLETHKSEVKRNSE